MPDPAAKAQWVLNTRRIVGIPALSLLDIAKHEDIRVLYEPIPEEPNFCGEILYQGEKKGILINTCIDAPQRHTFTFAHELGHYFLKHSPSYVQDDATGFFCSTEDINVGHRPIEREANAFATALLMPEDRFRPLTLGAPFDFTLINALAREFQVSKQACSYRILDFMSDACVVIHSKYGKINAQRMSRAARGVLRELLHIPEGTAAHEAINNKHGQDDFAECDPAKWLVRYTPSTRLYECTRGKFVNGTAMTILRWRSL